MKWMRHCMWNQNQNQAQDVNQSPSQEATQPPAPAAADCSAPSGRCHRDLVVVYSHHCCLCVYMNKHIVSIPSLL